MVNAEEPTLERLLTDLWNHSLSAGICSTIIAKHLQLPDPESLFMAGLLHDIGKLIVLKVLIHLSERGCSYDETMLEGYLAANHARFGGALMRKWRFAEEFVDVALHHHVDSSLQNHSRAVQIVAFANLLAHHLTERGGEGVAELADTHPASLLSLDSDAIMQVCGQAIEEIGQIDGLI
jgi:putative nucleotidyltransferase with HDIG domain